MKRIYFYLVFMTLAFLAACTKAPDYPTEPVITYKGINKKVITQGSSSAPVDTLKFMFTFTDGDGDLKDGKIFIYDSRDSSINIPGNLTLIPEESYANGVSGEILVNVPTRSKDSQICCITDYGDFQRLCYVDPRFPQDTFSYSIQIQDRAGNISNTVYTDIITILCK